MSERWVRGGIGFVLGSMIGTMLGGGVAIIAATEAAHEHEAWSKRPWPLWVATGLTVAGGVGGAVMGAHKKEC